MKDLSFSWTSEDLENLDNFSLRFVAHPSPYECLQKDVWDNNGALFDDLKKGDVLGLVDKGFLVATGIVCDIKHKGYQVWWACKEINVNLEAQKIETLPSPKYLLHDLKNTELARIITRTAYRFGR